MSSLCTISGSALFIPLEKEFALDGSAIDSAPMPTMNGCFQRETDEAREWRRASASDSIETLWNGLQQRGEYPAFESARRVTRGCVIREDGARAVVLAFWPKSGGFEMFWGVLFWGRCAVGDGYRLMVPTKSLTTSPTSLTWLIARAGRCSGVRAGQFKTSVPGFFWSVSQTAYTYAFDLKTALWAWSMLLWRGVVESFSHWRSLADPPTLSALVQSGSPPVRAFVPGWPVDVCEIR